jgi:hypothetical protein
MKVDLHSLGSFIEEENLLFLKNECLLIVENDT